MISRKILSKILIFVSGFLTSWVVIVLLGLTIDYLYPDMALGLTNKPKRIFGSVKVWVQKSLPSERIHPLIQGRIHKKLWITVDDEPLAVIIQDPNGRITDFYLLKNKEQAILSLERSDSSNNWEKAYYSEGGSESVPQGDVYVDIDFDGRFDCKLAISDNGELLSRYIYFNNSWIEVDDFNISKSSASAGPIEYVFTPESGWSKR